MYCTANFISVTEASRFVTFKVENLSQTPSPRLGPSNVRTILTTFYHMHRYYGVSTMQLLVRMLIVTVLHRISIKCNRVLSDIPWLK
jgi:hypothetical protein